MNDTLDANKISDKIELLKPKEAAKVLKCSTGCLANWRALEKGPRFCKMPNGQILYPKNELEDFLQTHSKKYTNNRMIPMNEIAHAFFGVV